jgi:hypothetical protein
MDYQTAKAEYNRALSAAHGFRGGIMRIGIMLYRRTVATKDFFATVRIGWAVSLAKLAVSVVSHIVRVP